MEQLLICTAPLTRFTVDDVEQGIANFGERKALPHGINSGSTDVHREYTHCS